MGLTGITQCNNHASTLYLHWSFPLLLLICVMLQLRAEQNATSDNFNVTAA